jgi:aspartate-semialdehyde dehydrogenase
MAGDGYRVGVLGATGMVGSTILEVLAERGFPASEVVPFASERSAGRRLDWNGSELECRPLEEETIQGLDLVLSSAGGSVSAEWAPRLVEAGAVVIDNTSYWRMHDDVPLVVAGVNPDAAGAHHGIIANPNCTTMVMMMALAPIHRAAGIERLVVSTYQAVSGTGHRAVEELREQARAVLGSGAEVPAPSVYPHQIAFNVLPQVEVFKDGDDYTTEERKVMGETRKILDAGEELGISVTCARVPVMVGHSESVNVRTRGDLSPEACRELLAAASGVVVIDEPGAGGYPTALEATGRDEVLVGRIRRDPSQERTINLWIVGDNLRKGAATNAVQVAELLAERGLLPTPA